MLKDALLGSLYEMIVVEWSQISVLSRPTNLDICILAQLHVSVMQGRRDLIFSGA